MDVVKLTPAEEMKLEKKKRFAALAQEVVQLAKGQLLVNLRFLDRALFELKLFEIDEDKDETGELNLATDGRYLLYKSRWILEQYRAKQNSVMR